MTIYPIHRPIRVLLFVSLLLGSLGRASVAQPAVGTLAGVVVDAATHLPVPTASVYLEGLDRGTAADSLGRFALAGIPIGSYVLTVRSVGYTPERRPIDIAAGAFVDLNIELQPATIELDEVFAEADRPYSAASSVTVRALDLRTRPTRSAQDLLQLTPGLITAQHAGGGKAEQIFLRGFDADHGTDVAVSVDGMPVNMVSHGHGQGYADLHFLLPEVVERIDVAKGPYEAQYGNLSTAGAVAFTTRDHLDRNLIRVEIGRFNTANVTGLYQIPLPRTEHQGAYLAGQFYQSDGPVDSPQGFQRFNVFGKVHTHLSESATLAMSVSGFSSAWDASGQIPSRAVAARTIGRFGSLDDLEGGTTGRQDLNVTYSAESGDAAFVLHGFTSRYAFKLFSNFTYFLEDPVDGDMIEQTDDRRLFGINGRYSRRHHIATRFAKATLGAGFRADDADVQLWKSPNRIRQLARVDADFAERNLYLWAQEELFFSSRIRLQLGLRGDYFTFDVDDRLEGMPATLPHASGYAQQAILSPKANLVVSPTSYLDLFANFGTSFHSNDARAIVQGERVHNLVRAYEREGLSADDIDARLAAQFFDPQQRNVGTLPRAVGTEIGARAHLASRLHLAAAAWVLDLEREFVYVGDGGFTELSGATRRYGLDLEARLHLTGWLVADGDLNLARGFFKEEPAHADAIPLAPRLTSTGGLTALHPSGAEAGLRYLHVGDRPANENGSVTAQGYTLVNLFLAYSFGPVRATLALENAMDVDWNEAQFDTESRLRGEDEPISELHFTPGNPRNVRVGISYLF
jgi:outer membrane receptor protein involved in Fe transport